MNFLNPVKFCLSLYQDYEWTVNVSRDIVRKIKIKNQVGSALVDRLYEERYCLCRFDRAALFTKH